MSKRRRLGRVFWWWHVAAEKFIRTPLEGAHHDFYCLPEDPLYHQLKHAGMKFEVDKKIDGAGISSFRNENPVIVQVSKGPIGIRYVNSVGTIERDCGREAFAKHPISDDQIRHDQILFAPPDAGINAPGQKLGVFVYRRDEIEQLSGGVM